MTTEYTGDPSAPAVAEYNEWKQAILDGSTNMGFETWRVSREISAWLAAQPHCEHPFDQVKIKGRDIVCGLCGATRRP